MLRRWTSTSSYSMKWKKMRKECGIASWHGSHVMLEKKTSHRQRLSYSSCLLDELRQDEASTK